MNHECIFCQIIDKKLPASVVYEDERLIVFKDIHPEAPVHLLMVPKKHIRSVNDLSGEDREIVSEMMMAAPAVARLASVDRSGYRLVLNVERGGGQVIFHLHMHLLGGWKRQA